MPIHHAVKHLKHDSKCIEIFGTFNKKYDESET